MAQLLLCRPSELQVRRDKDVGTVSLKLTMNLAVIVSGPSIVEMIIIGLGTASQYKKK